MSTRNQEFRIRALSEMLSREGFSPRGATVANAEAFALRTSTGARKTL